ncbi:MAG: hypothetical protein KatS3mg007_2114 [Thermoanaerobaculum sp.]|nr:MAG: hypothetical protein KatS3mg007_2114 [Thermoanaerobaculum sp.]
MKGLLKAFVVSTALLFVGVSEVESEQWAYEPDYEFTDPCLVGDPIIWRDYCERGWGSGGGGGIWPCWDCLRCRLLTQTQYTYANCCRGSGCDIRPPGFICFRHQMGLANCWITDNAPDGATCRGQKC